MNFAGIQKISLVDFDKELSCTLFTMGCQLRCPFCHNYEIVVYNSEKIESISFDSIYEYLKEKRKYLSAVVITGGEPTMHPELKEVIIKIKELGYKVKLDTNGLNPDIMIELINKKLIDYVAVDIKNSKEEYGRTSGVAFLDIESIDRTIKYLISHDFPYEFRTTLVDEFHTTSSIESMGKWLNGANKLYLQKFSLSSNVPNQDLHSVEIKNALAFRRILEENIQSVELRGY